MATFTRYPFANQDRFTKILMAIYVFFSLLYMLNIKQQLDVATSKYELLQQSVGSNKEMFPFTSIQNVELLDQSELIPNATSTQFTRGMVIPVLPLNKTGHIVFPNTVKRVWFDVGAHRKAMYTLPHVQLNPDLAVVAFEPMYDMWGELFMKWHHERLYPIPAAVSLTDGLISFRRASTDMCSSIKGIEAGADNFRWPGGCTGTNFVVNVPTLRLETVIDMLPFELVDFVKVDAQGADFEVMQSAGKNLWRIKSFVVEVQTDPLYKDTHTEKDFVDYFQTNGFELVDKKFQNKHELNLLFRNTKYPMPDNIPMDEFFVEGKKPKA